MNDATYTIVITPKDKPKEHIYLYIITAFNDIELIKNCVKDNHIPLKKKKKKCCVIM